MARTPPRRAVNGTRTHFIPMTPDSILLHHLIQTQTWHTHEIARLSTQISSLQKRRSTRSFQWKEVLPWVWGILMLIAGVVSPQTVDRVAKMMAVIR